MKPTTQLRVSRGTCEYSPGVGYHSYIFLQFVWLLQEPVDLTTGVANKGCGRLIYPIKSEKCHSGCIQLCGTLCKLFASAVGALHSPVDQGVSRSTHCRVDECLCCSLESVSKILHSFLHDNVEITLRGTRLRGTR